MAKNTKRQSTSTPLRITPEQVSAVACALPGVVEGPSYGTPGFRVGKQLFARLHQDGESLVIWMDPAERAMRMRANPETFYITDHYLNYPWMLVRLSRVSLDDLRELLEDAWRNRAPRRLPCQRSQARRPKQPPPKSPPILPGGPDQHGSPADRAECSSTAIAGRATSHLDMSQR